MAEPADPTRGTALFVAYFFPPIGGGGVQRTVKFVKYLRLLGWRSEVITVERGDYWVEDGSLVADVPVDTIVHRTRAWTGLSLMAKAKRLFSRGRVAPGGGPEGPRATPGSGGGKAGASRARRSTRGFAFLRWLSSLVLVPDAYVGWRSYARAAALDRISKGHVDVLVTTSSPDTAHLVGLDVKSRTGVPWIADFRDPWVRRITFQAPTPLHHRWHTSLERRVLEQADRILVTNEATRDDFLARHVGVAADRFCVIPNGFDPEDLEGLEDVVAPFVPSADRTTFLHSGLLSGGRTLTPLTGALDRLRREDGAIGRSFELVQIGPMEEVNVTLVRAAGLDDVTRFLPPVSHPEVLAAMHAADVLVLIEHGGERGALITPGKIFEYLASGRPILAIVPEGPAADLVREFDAGEVVHPDDADRLTRVLSSWIKAPPAPVDRGTALAAYTRRELTARLAQVLDTLRDAS